MDIIGSVVGGVETGCQYLSLATKIVGRVARLECWERLADNIKQVYQKCAHLEALKTYIVRPVGFALSTHRVLGLNVLSLATQKGIENITKELGGYANASLLFTPLYRAFSFFKNPSPDAFRFFILGWNGGDSLAATAAKGIKFFADSKLGFNFLMDRFPSPSFSFAKQAPIAAAAFGWIASDRGVCLSAIFNVYQNAKGLSLAQLQEVVGLPSLQVICSRVDQDSTRQKEVVKKTLGVVMYSSAAMMAVYKIFHKQVASSYPLAVLNTALCGVAVVSGILFDRWKDNSSMPARL